MVLDWASCRKTVQQADGDARARTVGCDAAETIWSDGLPLLKYGMPSGRSIDIDLV